MKTGSMASMPAHQASNLPQQSSVMGVGLSIGGSNPALQNNINFGKLTLGSAADPHNSIFTGNFASNKSSINTAVVSGSHGAQQVKNQSVVGAISPAKLPKGSPAPGSHHQYQKGKRQSQGNFIVTNGSPATNQLLNQQAGNQRSIIQFGGASADNSPTIAQGVRIQQRDRVNAGGGKPALKVGAGPQPVGMALLPTS